MKNRILAGLLLLISGVANGQTLDSLEFAQPDAKVLIGINVRQIRNSAVAEAAKKAFTEQLKSVPPMAANLPGLEFFDDIDFVFIASPGTPAGTPPAASASRANPAGRPGASAASRNNPPFVMVLQGNFPATHVQTLLKGTQSTPKMVNGFMVYQSPKASDPSLALLNERTIVLADAKSLPAALARRGGAPAVSSDLIARAATLASNNDFWLVVSDLGSAVFSAASLSATSGPGGGSGNPGAAMAAQFASEIEGMEIGISLRQGFGMDLNLSAKNESTVQFLASLLGSQLQLAATQSKDAQAADLLKKLNVSAQGKRLNVGVRLSEEEFERNVKALQTARMSPPGAGAAATAPTRTASPAGDVSIFPPPANKSSQSRPQAQPEPEGPRKIRIFGLEGGVKEIPLDSNGNGR